MMRASELLNEASVIKKLKGTSKRRKAKSARAARRAKKSNKIRNPQTGRYTTQQDLSGYNAFNQMAGQLAPNAAAPATPVAPAQVAPTNNAPQTNTQGAGAFGSMASQLGSKPNNATPTSSTGGTTATTPTGLTHTASKTNPNTQPQAQAAPAPKPKKTFTPPPSSNISKADQNQALSSALSSINKLGNLHTLRKIKQVLDAKMAQFEPK